MSTKEKDHFTRHTEFERLCIDFGGQMAMAKALGVTQGAVSQWIRGEKTISPKMALRIIELVGHTITPEMLNPDFPWEIARKLR
jgi:DNA-binding transcriptional regulator YdaS (Cro superfamily)